MTLRNADPVTLRMVADLAREEARRNRRAEEDCQGRGLPGEPIYAGRAFALESFARGLENRATRAERARARTP